jgi:glucose/arabinose dehydrogenase
MWEFIGVKEMDKTRLERDWELKQYGAVILMTFLIASTIVGLLTTSVPMPIAIAAPADFVDSVLASGLNLPTSMEFSPDGRLFITEKDGTVRIVKNGALLSTPFLTLSVDSSGERGLLGLAFDPNFQTNGYVYVYYTTSSGTIHNRVSRFVADTVNPDRAVASSETIILELESLIGGFHNGGAIHFGKDGKLYVATGDNFRSANSQSLETRLGKILRINSDGTIPSDNPFYNTAGAKKEIWALGLRNPFTFVFSPASGSTLMYINDVGADAREEINLGIAGANYGWPTCEGSCSNPGFVNPVYSYPHPSDGTGASIIGGAFYESNQFPPEYKGSYFFADYVAGFMKRLTPTNQVVDFVSDVPYVVDIKVAPDGSLYYLSIGLGEVHRIRYMSGDNSNPNAVFTANPTSGAAPLQVSFDGSASSDADAGQVLTYSWDFGDGSALAGGKTVGHTYQNAGPYSAKLTVGDGHGGTDSDIVTIIVGTPPVGTIITPATGTKYDAGDTISFSGSATDVQDGTLPNSAFKWTILLHHNTHTHPFLEFDGVKTGSFIIPRISETSDDVWYRIYLTVKDSTGLSHLSTRDVLPNKATITLNTSIPGMQVLLDGQPRTTPSSFVGVVGITRNLQVPLEQVLNGNTYRFDSWSDGGTASHDIDTPSVATTYTAKYVLKSATLTVGSQDSNGNALAGYWTVLRNSAGAVLETGFSPITFTLNSGQEYSVAVGDYGDQVFDHWLNDDSTARRKTVSISGDTQLTAVYKQMNSGGGTTPPQDNIPPIITASPTGGTYSATQLVTLVSNEAGTVIYYTVDGSDPTSSGTRVQYNGTPVSISSTLMLRYYGLDAASNPSSPQSANYVIQTSQSFPIVHMSDTTDTLGIVSYSTRPIHAEYVAASSALVGDRVDSITIRLSRAGSPTGTVEVGVFNENLSVKKLFGTMQASSLSSIYQDYEFKLSGADLYTIQSGDRIGVKFTGGDVSNTILVMTDKDAPDPFDGSNSYRTHYIDGVWRDYTSYDLYMILKQTHG